MKKNILKKIWSDYVLVQGKKKIFFFLFLAFLVTLFGVLEPLFFAEIISKIETFYKTGEFDFNELIIFLGFWILFIVFSIVINFIYSYIVSEKSSLDFLSEKFKQNIEKVLYIKYGEAISKEQGKLYKIFDRGIDSFFNISMIFVGDIIIPILQIIFIFIIMLYVNVKMAFITISILPILIYLGVFVKNKTIKIQKKLDENWEDIFGKIGDSFTNTGLVKFLSLEKIFLKNIKKQFGELYIKQRSVQKRWAFGLIVTKMCIMVAKLLVLSFGIYFVVNGEISLAVLFLFFSYIGYIYFPVGVVFNKLKQIQESITKIEKFYKEIEDLEQDFIRKKDKKKKLFGEISGKIEFKNISFGYTEDRKIFKDLNFEIKPGEKIAFVGNTGAGKSTIVNLLFRLWDSNSGSILLDGEDIYKYSKSSLRKNIGLVSQDNSLFNTSIRENLEYAFSGEKEKSEEKINEALKKAHADFVFKLKDGIDTVIGERGLKLSGGEKQRLSIARLFLKNPKILVLDEATSALDNKTENFIQDSLDKLMKGKTSIVIAHRLSTIQNVDKIFMLENGKIIETGNYNELISKKGKFWELANPDNLIVR